MVPCCPCVSMRRNQGRLTESLNEGTHLFLRQNAVESLYKVAHGSLAIASYHIIDSMDNRFANNEKHKYLFILLMQLLLA